MLYIFYHEILQATRTASKRKDYTRSVENLHKRNRVGWNDKSTENNGFHGRTTFSRTMSCTEISGVEWRIKFKIACITYKTISTFSTTQPAYLYSSLKHYTPSPTLRSSDSNCCSFPVSAHVSVLAASLLPLQLFGTPFLWPFVVGVSTYSFRR